jgi:hypothetical protein
MDKQQHILVVGGGSAGQRHSKILLDAGAEVTVVEADRSKNDALLGLGIHGVINNLAYAPSHITGAIVAVPTYLHAQCALPLLEAGLPVLIEKPLAHTVADAERLRPYAAQIRVGYSMRFHPAIQLIREHLPEIGRVIFAHAEVGQYLPQWHPDENYRNWYMAHAAQGGGALLELSHELDYLQWLIAPIVFTKGNAVHTDHTLQIDSDDLAMLSGTMLPHDYVHIARFTCRMDLIDRRYNRRVRILGEKDTICWDNDRRVVQAGSLFIPYPVERLIQFQREASEFLAFAAGQPAPTLCTYDDAFRTLAVCEGIRTKGMYTV